MFETSNIYVYNSCKWYVSIMPRVLTQIAMQTFITICLSSQTDQSVSSLTSPILSSRSNLIHCVWSFYPNFIQRPLFKTTQVMICSRRSSRNIDFSFSSFEYFSIICWYDFRSRVFAFFDSLKSFNIVGGVLNGIIETLTSIYVT